MSPDLQEGPGRAPIGRGHLASPDHSVRAQIAMAAALLRSIRPADGEIEIALHEIARRLEHIADTGRAGRQTFAFPGHQLDSLVT